MPSIQKSIRLPAETLREIEKIARDGGKDFSAITKDLLEEAIKMRRCPGIVFADGATGRRARVLGTGIEVWEIIAAYQNLNRGFERLKKAYHWLTSEQLRSALAYYAIYPKEIDNQISQNESWDERKLQEHFPVLSLNSRN